MLKLPKFHMPNFFMGTYFAQYSTAFKVIEELSTYLEVPLDYKKYINTKLPTRVDIVHTKELTETLGIVLKAFLGDELYAQYQKQDVLKEGIRNKIKEVYLAWIKQLDTKKLLHMEFLDGEVAEGNAVSIAISLPANFRDKVWLARKLEPVMKEVAPMLGGDAPSLAQVLKSINASEPETESKESDKQQSESPTVTLHTGK